MTRDGAVLFINHRDLRSVGSTRNLGVFPEQIGTSWEKREYSQILACYKVNIIPLICHTI